MLTLSPTLTWRSKCLFLLSILFWLLFASFTAFLAQKVLIRFIQHADKNSAPGLVIAALIAIGAAFWLFGMIRTPGRTFQAHTDATFLIWREHQSGKLRQEKKIELSSIQSYGPIGSPGIGYYLQVSTRNKDHRLGSLLSISDIEQVSQLIGQSIATATTPNPSSP